MRYLFTLFPFSFGAQTLLSSLAMIISPGFNPAWPLSPLSISSTAAIEVHAVVPARITHVKPLLSWTKFASRQHEVEREADAIWEQVLPTILPGIYTSLVYTQTTSSRF